jgi:hypothetical protein
MGDNFHNAGNKYKRQKQTLGVVYPDSQANIVIYFSITIFYDIVQYKSL